jgi:hypothetical protein
MTIPRTLNTKTKPTNDPKLAGMKAITSLSIEKIAAVNDSGAKSYDIEKFVKHMFL